MGVSESDPVPAEIPVNPIIGSNKANLLNNAREQFKEGRLPAAVQFWLTGVSLPDDPNSTLEQDFNKLAHEMSVRIGKLHAKGRLVAAISIHPENSMPNGEWKKAYEEYVQAMLLLPEIVDYGIPFDPRGRKLPPLTREVMIDLLAMEITYKPQSFKEVFVKRNVLAETVSRLYPADTNKTRKITYFWNEACSELHEKGVNT